MGEDFGSKLGWFKIHRKIHIQLHPLGLWPLANISVSCPSSTQLSKDRLPASEMSRNLGLFLVQIQDSNPAPHPPLPTLVEQRCDPQ